MDCVYCQKSIEGSFVTHKGLVYHDRCAEKANIEGQKGHNDGNRLQDRNTMIAIRRTDRKRLQIIQGNMQSRGSRYSIPEVLNEVLDGYDMYMKIKAQGRL